MGGDPCDMSAGDSIGFVEDPDLEEVIFSDPHPIIANQNPKT